MSKYTPRKYNKITAKQETFLTKKQQQQLEQVRGMNKHLEEIGSNARINEKDALNDGRTFRSTKRIYNEAIKVKDEAKQIERERRTSLISKSIQDHKDARLSLKENNVNIQGLAMYTNMTDNRMKLTPKQYRDKLNKMSTKDIARMRSLDEKTRSKMVGEYATKYLIDTYFKQLKQFNPKLYNKKLKDIIKFAEAHPLEMAKLINYTQSDVFKGDAYMLDNVDMGVDYEAEAEMARRLEDLHGYTQSVMKAKTDQEKTKAKRLLPWNSGNM